MTDEPIDVAAFVAQLADDEHLERELAGLAAPRPVAERTRTTMLDRAVARALVVLLECQLRGLNVLTNGPEYEAALYAELGELNLQEPVDYDDAVEVIRARLAEQERDQ